MQYGLIGEHLGHSFSKEIHEGLGRYTYQIQELAPAEVAGFIAAREFRGINVTIPYKEVVIPLLDEVDPAAAAIGAVNTVVNRDGKLYGYNTDFAGMKALIQRMGLDFTGKKVLILGTGGTSKTAAAVARDLGAAVVLRASRTGREDAITYEEAAANHSDAAFLINTTPCGMFPDKEDLTAVNIDDYPALEGVVDAVYNPLHTLLVRQVRMRHIKADGGLYMLVAQAVFAARHFLGEELDVEGLTERLYKKKLWEYIDACTGEGESESETDPDPDETHEEN